MAAVIDPSAIIARSAPLGAGCRVWEFVNVSPGVRIGKRCSSDRGVCIASKVAIGSIVDVQSSVSIFEAVMLEDDTSCKPGAVFTDLCNPSSAIARKDNNRYNTGRVAAVHVAAGTIVCGTTLGEDGIFGAGAMRTREVPELSLVPDAPARHGGWTGRLA